MSHANEFEAYVTPSTLSYYANTNEDLLIGPPQAILLEFPGLGGGSCLGGSQDRAPYATRFATRCGELGILLVYLFPGPWSWGNKGATRLGDAVVTALAKKYGLCLSDGSLPLGVCGGSMGGLGALNYAADTALPLRVCASACPCVDVLDRFTCHPDFPRTFLSAVASYDLPLTEALRSISPVERISEMPLIPYFICSDERDAIFPESQCDDYVTRLSEAGHTVIYRRQPEQLHGHFLPEVIAELRQFLTDTLLA